MVWDEGIFLLEIFRVQVKKQRNEKECVFDEKLQKASQFVVRKMRSNGKECVSCLEESKECVSFFLSRLRFNVF